MMLLALVLTAGAIADDAPTAAERAHDLWVQAARLHVEGNYEAALATYREALALHPTARIHNYMAWSLSELDRYQDAVDHCRAAIRLDPEYPNAYNDLGAYLIELGRPSEAEPWLRRAMGMDGYCCPHFPHYQLGRALLMEGRVEQAVPELQRALAIRPRYRPAIDLLIEIRKRQLEGS